MRFPVEQPLGSPDSAMPENAPQIVFRTGEYIAESEQLPASDFNRNHIVFRPPQDRCVVNGFFAQQRAGIECGIMFRYGESVGHCTG